MWTGGKTTYVVFAVPFSENLGDGVIFECLRKAISQIDSSAVVIPADISGRQRFPSKKRESIAFARAALAKLPSKFRPLLPLIVFGLIRRRGLERHLSQLAVQGDLAILGGGHLFSDANLNFPVKISILGRVLRPARRPVAVYSVGVSEGWSKMGKCLFIKALQDLKPVHISVRDEVSAKAFSGQTKLATPRITLDPGILCSQFFPVETRGGGLAPVGINVIGTEALVLDANSPRWAKSLGALFYSRLGRGLINVGFRIVYFTNGAEEDERELDALTLHDPSLFSHSQVHRAPRPERPLELMQRIAGLRALISHRLHANIIAYSYGVPSIGLAWDQKVESFFSLVGRERYLVPRGAQSPDYVVNLLKGAVDEGVSPLDRRRVIDKAFNDVVSLIAVLKNAGR